MAEFAFENLPLCSKSFGSYDEGLGLRTVRILSLISFNSITAF